MSRGSRYRAAVALLTLLSNVLPAASLAGAQDRPVDRLSPFERAKVEQLLTTRLPCLGCHTIDGKGGRQAPDLSDVGNRLTARQITDRIASPHRAQPDSTMPAAPMPAPWRDVLVRYLLAHDGNKNPSVVSVMPLPAPGRPRSSGVAPDGANGRHLYARFCSGCHGDEGRGNGPNAAFLPVPPTIHSDTRLMSLRSDDQLFDTVAGGGYLMNRHPFMPAYGTTLGAPDIRALVQHIRVLCACRGPSWSSDGDRTTRR